MTDNTDQVPYQPEKQSIPSLFQNVPPQYESDRYYHYDSARRGYDYYHSQDYQPGFVQGSAYRMPEPSQYQFHYPYGGDPQYQRYYYDDRQQSYRDSNLSEPAEIKENKRKNLVQTTLTFTKKKTPSETSGSTSVRHKPLYMDDLDPEFQHAPPLGTLKSADSGRFGGSRIHQIYGIHRFLLVFAKPLLNWKTPIPEFKEFATLFAPIPQHCELLLDYYALMLTFLGAVKSRDKILIQSVLVEYLEDVAESLVEELEEKEFYSISGSTHMEIFQILIDDISQEESFRTYISEVNERKQDLKAHREFILDQKRKETTTKTELIEEMADLQKEITELKQKEGFSDQDPEYRQKMSEYKHLEASLEEKNNALATLEVEDQNNQTDTNLLLSITAKKPECMLGLDRHGAVYWHIPLDTNPDQPVFGIIVNDPMDKSKWFTFSNIHMLVSFLGTLLPNGIRESSLKNALLKLHEPYNVVLSKQIDPLVSAGASKINTAYEQFNQFMLTEEITVQDLSTFESDCLPPVVEAMEKLAIALDKSIEGLEQCKSVEDFKSKIEISWLNATDLLDESDLEYLQETKSLSALYNWALDTEDHVQNELLHQAKKEKEIQRKQEREKQMRQQELEQQKLQQSRKRNTRSKTESRPNSASRQSRTITTRSGRELRRDRSSSDVGASESEMVTRSGQRKRSSVSDSYSTRKQRKMESSSEAESTESEKEPPKTRGRKQASREASPEPKPRNTRQRKKASVESSPEPTVTKKRSSIVVVDSSPEPKPSATKKRSSIVVVDESSEPEQKAVPPKAWSGEMMKKKKSRHISSTDQSDSDDELTRH